MSDEWTVERHLLDKPAQVVALYDRFLELAGACGPFTLSVTKTAITLKGTRRGFAGLKPRSAWLDGYLDEVPKEEEARKAYIKGRFQQRDGSIADRYRDRLVELYGERKGKAIKYAEAFELCEYGSQPTLEELKKLFPFF